MTVEWDDAKNLANQRKHGISFDEVAPLFSAEADFLELFDEAHSGEEERVVVVWTERGDDVVRIISARRATKREQALFREYMGSRND